MCQHVNTKEMLNRVVWGDKAIIDMTLFAYCGHSLNNMAPVPLLVFLRAQAYRTPGSKTVWSITEGEKLFSRCVSLHVWAS